MFLSSVLDLLIINIRFDYSGVNEKLRLSIEKSTNDISHRTFAVIPQYSFW